MKILSRLALLSGMALATTTHAQQVRYNAISSGTPWTDDQGNAVSAHGACILKEGTTFYLFGERHTDTCNRFAGFNCYSSSDLYNWKFESIALPVQPSGKMGPDHVGERVKVMKCPKTGEFVMFMHADTLGYTDQFVGYATASTVTGPYTFKGPLLFNGKPIRKWDIGTFQDEDGKGYVLLHGGDIYQLAEDYSSITAMVHKNMTHGFESPAIFRKDSLYYFLGSDLTGWERNDNTYFTATALAGPWTKRGFFAPAGSLTFNSQTTFVLPVTGSKQTTYMYMGDRWSFPRQATAATYVWQPLVVKGVELSLPVWRESWQLNTKTGVVADLVWKGTTIPVTDKKRVQEYGSWKQVKVEGATLLRSDVKEDSLVFRFSGKRVALYGLSDSTGGYAAIIIRNAAGAAVCNATVDMYCRYPVKALTFISPLLPAANYTLTVKVKGEHWYWMDKKKNRFGAKGTYITVEKIKIIE